MPWHSTWCFEELAEALGEPVCVVHPNGTLLYGNRKWHALTAIVEGADFPGSLWGLIHPEDRERWLRSWQGALSSHQPYDIERRIRGATDSDYECQLEHGHPVRDPNGTVVEWVLYAGRSSENQRLIEGLRRCLRRKDEFLAAVAHEMRNPLAPIVNALHTLERHGDDPILAVKARTLIARQVTLLSRLVEDLLDLARLGHGQLALRSAPVDLREVLEKSLETAQPAISAREHNLKSFVPTQAVIVPGDAARLVQILVNLLINAAKFTDRGGSIAVTLEHDSRWARIKVGDTGIGIAPEQLATIFDTYVQADPAQSRSGNGLGLGLALAQRLARLHGGGLTAHSEGIGQGSEFVVQLPLEAD
jgi:signal transduction histidine kinase